MYKAIRYIGSKQKVLPFLEEHLFSKLTSGDSFFDGFLGTGIVSQYIAETKNNINVSGGDISLYSEVLFKIMNIGSLFKREEIVDLIKKFELENLVAGNIFNEFSNKGTPCSFTESRNFYHEKSGKIIDTFKLFLGKELKNQNISSQQAEILLFFILAYACKAGNTTSVFGAYLKSPAKYIEFNVKFVENILNELSIFLINKNQFDFYLGSIVDNLKLIPKQKIIYLDPPYSTRRYETNYHILNFVVDFEFNPKNLKENSKTGQPKGIVNNPFGSKKETEIIFAEMIREGVNKSDFLGISYNTDGVITQKWIEKFCIDNNYKLETKKMSYKRFKSKVEVKNETNLEEILWIITK